MTFLATTDAVDVEQRLANKAFIHGVTYAADITRALAIYNIRLSTANTIAFEEVRIETAANRKSVMGRSRYDAYNKAFSLRIPIRLSTSARIEVIAGSVMVIGNARI